MELNIQTKIKSRIHPPLFFLVLGILLSGATLSAETIKKISILGNKKIETGAVVAKLKSQTGTKLSQQTIREDIRSVYSLGFFDDISVSTNELGSGGVELVFKLTEKPIVSEIVFEGLDAIDEDTAKEELLIKRYEVLSIHKINQSEEKLRKKYEEEGFFLAEVRHEIITSDATNEVEVHFKVKENAKTKVKRINIIGNKVLSDSELKKIMQTQEGGALSFITGSGTYRDGSFDRDVQAMQYYYGTQGFVRAQVSKPTVSVSPDKKWIYITVSVIEGEKYTVGDVDFSGNLLFDRDELMGDLQLKKGEVFNSDLLRRETLRYTEKYSDLGYAFANVIPQPEIDDTNRIVNLTFEVEPDRKVYIGRITMSGNTRTKDRVIRQQLLIHEGELFNGTKKRISRENVYRLGFFETVEFNQTTSKVDSSIVNIDIQVKEQSTGQLVIGAGYASGNIGFTANAQLSQNNFLGNGQVASLSAQIQTGTDFYEASLSFTEPHVYSSNWSLGGELYHLRRDILAFTSVPTFREAKSGGAIKLGHPVFDYTNLYMTYKLENSDVDPSTIIDRAIIPENSVNGTASSVAASVVYDKRDNRFDPRDGLFWSLSSEYAGFGGSRNFLKSRGTFKFFHPLFWDFVFRMNVTGANIIQTSTTPIPINERFIQGGLYSLRGYDVLSIGPKATLGTDNSTLSQAAVDASLQGKEIVIGGENELLANVEVEFPLFKEARIRGVLFFDVGNTFNGWFENTSPKLYANAGWGIRWFTPIGPLRFEFGYPIVNTGKPRFYFTIGPAF